MKKRHLFRGHRGDRGGNWFPLRQFRKSHQQRTADQKGHPFGNRGTRDDGS